MPGQSYRFQVGDRTCIALEDMAFTAKAQILFGNLSDLEVEREMRRRGLDPLAIPESGTCLVVRMDDEWVLFDAGHGGALGGAPGLLPALRAEGIEPEAIGALVLTHAHLDSVGGLLDADGELVFRNARYYMSRVEWEACASETGLAEMAEFSAERARWLRRHLHPLQPRLHLVEDQQEFMPGMWAFLTPGHAPGHMSILIRSGNDRLIVAGDVAAHPLHLENPGWESTSDANPRRARQMREYFAACACHYKALVLVYHFAFPGLGMIVADNGAYRFEPLAERVTPFG